MRFCFIEWEGGYMKIKGNLTDFTVDTFAYLSKKNTMILPLSFYENFYLMVLEILSFSTSLFLWLECLLFPLQERVTGIE